MDKYVLILIWGGLLFGVCIAVIAFQKFLCWLVDEFSDHINDREHLTTNILLTMIASLLILQIIVQLKLR